LERGEMSCAVVQKSVRREKDLGWLDPHAPGNSDDYQKKGVAGGAICMNVKTKDLEKPASLGRVWREKWGRKIRMRAS